MMMLKELTQYVPIELSSYFVYCWYQEGETGDSEREGREETERFSNFAQDL